MARTKEGKDQEKEEVKSSEKAPNTSSGEKEHKKDGENPCTGEESRLSDSREDEACGENPETGKENC